LVSVEFELPALPLDAPAEVLPVSETLPEVAVWLDWLVTVTLVMLVMVVTCLLEFTNDTQSPWFLNRREPSGFLKVFQPPFLHWSAEVGAASTTTLPLATTELVVV